MRLRRNKFLARPDAQRLYSATHGVSSHPGFHTGSSVDVVAPYAQMRFEDSRRKDAPIIVELDMRGLQPLPDYDAEKYVLGPLQDIVRYNVSRPGDLQSSLDDLQSYLEAGEVETPEPQNAIEALFLLHPSQQDPTAMLIEVLESLPEEKAVETLLALARGGDLDPQVLMDITAQYRYLDDVDEDRIVAIYEMKPLWPDIFPYDGEGYEDEIEGLESQGFLVLTEGEDASVETKMLWGRSQEGSEFHGTSWESLRKAAPNIVREL